MTNSMVHFEIPANDVARAKSFYSKIFGWRIEAWNDPSGLTDYSSLEHKSYES